MTEQEIVDRLVAVFANRNVFLVGKVIKVSGNQCDVQPLNADELVSGIKIAIIENASAVLTPAIDSIVVVGMKFINKMQVERFVVWASKYSKVKMITDGATKEYSLTKTEDLITELNKTNQLLASVLAVINGSPIPEPGSGAASAFQAALKAAIVDKGLGDYSNIKNEKIKHG